MTETVAVKDHDVGSAKRHVGLLHDAVGSRVVADQVVPPLGAEPVDEELDERGLAADCDGIGSRVHNGP